MKDNDKQIGILIEQGRWLAKELAEVKSDVKDIKAMKWKITGGLIAISFITTTIVAAIFR